MAEVQLLGPVTLRADGQVIDLGPPKQRIVFVALVLDAGRPVPVDTLVQRVWGDLPPAAARDALYTHVMRIRRALAVAAKTHVGDLRLDRDTGGYRLHIDPDCVDALRFREIVGGAAWQSQGDAKYAAVLDEALRLWRGRPFTDLSGDWLDRMRDSLAQLYLDAVTAWGRAHLQLGQYQAVIRRLSDDVLEHPLVESLTGVLMRALHAASRSHEALDHYSRMRKRLIQELGVDAGAELQRIHRAILRGDTESALALPPPGRSPAHAPAQLPMSVPTFAGRDRELAQLAQITTSAQERATAVVISAVSGTPGIGKTALAVHWAHRVRRQFPDGQLYVDLRGFDPGGSMMDPADAIRDFLHALGVPAHQVPAGLAGMSALYRSVLADRRMLVVLDNARDSAQARPLLPASRGCLVLVTSRSPLSGLVTAEGAYPVVLDLLTEAEAREMLSRRVGPVRTGAEPDAVEELIALSARLPLALAIVAARAAAQPGLALTGIAEELRHAGRRLDALAAGEITTDLRAVFSWSYGLLSPGAARLFRLLGLHPGPDIGTQAVASLAGCPMGEIRPLLAELTGANLIIERVSGRFSFHDLLRAYSRNLAAAQDRDDDRRDANCRMLDHYLHSAYTADRLLDPYREPITLDAPDPGVNPEEPAGAADALLWFDTERHVSLAVIERSSQDRHDIHTWQLAWSLGTYLDRCGHWPDILTTYQAALQAAHRLGDRNRQASIHRALGRAHTRSGAHGEAKKQLHRAFDLYRRMDDRSGQAHVQLELTRVYELQKRYRDALRLSQGAHTLYLAVGDQTGKARALNNIGWHLAQLGDYREALPRCEEALALHTDLGNRHGEANTWDSLGYIHHRIGHHHEATSCYRRALDLFREFGDRYYEADVLTHLGDIQHATGDVQSAQEVWRQALEILEELGHPDAEQIRTRLQEVG